MTATLEMKSYRLPEKMAKLRIASVEEPVKPETSVAAVSHRNATTVEVLEKLLKHMEKLKAHPSKQSERERRQWIGRRGQ